MRHVALALILLASPASAQSLWSQAGPNPSSIYADNVAHRRGDILTVIIREQQRLAIDEETELESVSTRQRLGYSGTARWQASSDTTVYGGLGYADRAGAMGAGGDRRSVDGIDESCDLRG